MTTNVKLTTAWHAIDTSTADVLITGGVYDVNLGDASPDDKSALHRLNQPFVAPKGVTCHVKAPDAAGTTIAVSPLG